MPLDDMKVRKWISNHRGILSRIAVQHGYSPQFVQAAAYGKASIHPGHVIEQILRSEGWPGHNRGR